MPVKTKKPSKPSVSKSPTVVTLGPWDDRYTPGYQILIYREGNPRKLISSSEVDLESVVSIETAKNIQNVAGTFSITLKDARAEHAVQPMDVVVIRLKGHRQPLTSVLHGLVDEVGKADSAEPESAQENTVITGRCMAKYLQVNSLFLPVWEPLGLLPTALTFGLGDSVHGNVPITVPKEIFGYVYRHFIVGEGNRVGISGTPAAQHWLNKDGRFELVSVRGEGTYHVPYVQFDENTTDQVLTALTITGFTEAWVDEFGYVVYRPPGWDLPVNYILDAGGLISDQLETSDVGLVTYCEVVPSGAVGISTAAQQAVAAGRAPVPSNYLTNPGAKSGDEGHAYVSPEFVIDADKQGKVTKKGAKNYWYKRQRKYGLRPYQVTSPLLVSHAQAQAQAEGLLKFLGNRLQKTGTVVIPGEPGIRLGTTLLLRGTIRGKKIERTYFVEGVNHEYVDGHAYKTTLELTHGRDPWDPEWERMVLPANPSNILAEQGGVSEGTSESTAGVAVIPGSKGSLQGSGQATAPASAPQAVQRLIAAGNQLVGKPYVFGGAHGESLTVIRSGYDCSSSVDYLLYHAGLLSDETPASTALESYGDAGVGKWITIYANPEHVYLYVAGLRWDTHQPGGSVGIGWYGQARSNEGFVARHPKGY